MITCFLVIKKHTFSHHSALSVNAYKQKKKTCLAVTFMPDIHMSLMFGVSVACHCVCGTILSMH